MDRAAFYAALRAKGFREVDGELRARARLTGATREMSYGEDARPTGVTSLDPRAGDDFAELSFPLEPQEIDEEYHFYAAIFGELDGEELVHVLEKGPFYDHVFLNLHDEGIETVEDLLDKDSFDPSTLTAVYSDEPYETVSNQTRLEWQPFFQNPVATSLADLVASLEVESR